MAVKNLIGNGCTGCFVAVWLLGWTAGVLVFDAVTIGTAYQQLRALTFPAADGVVTHCEVKSTGNTNQLDIAYSFEVDGQRYTGRRYSYGDAGTNTGAWHRVRDELPQGTRVAVAYDPDDPRESLLRPGLTGHHLSVVWFVTPFNLIMIGGWVGVFWGRRRAFDPTDPRTTVRTDTGWRVRLPAFNRWLRFGITLLAISVCGIFVWAFGFGFNPPVWLAGFGYLAAVAGAAWVAARRGPRWLEVDELARTFRVSAKPEPVEVPFVDIRDVIVRHEQKTDSEGDVTHKYHCELIRPNEQPLHLTEFSDPEEAAALAAWLRARVGLTPASDSHTAG